MRSYSEPSFEDRNLMFTDELIKYFCKFFLLRKFLFAIVIRRIEFRVKELRVIAYSWCYAQLIYTAPHIELPLVVSVYLQQDSRLSDQKKISIQHSSIAIGVYYFQVCQLNGVEADWIKIFYFSFLLSFIKYFWSRLFRFAFLISNRYLRHKFYITFLRYKSRFARYYRQ